MDRTKQQQQHDTDESVEEEIIEDISRIEGLEDSDFDDSDDIPIFLNDSKDDKENRMIMFSNENDDKLFDDDVDNILALDNIAKHFTATNDDDKILKASNSDKIVPLKAINSASNKENSPLTEDTIFINDRKVSISSLKKISDVNILQSEPQNSRESVGVSVQTVMSESVPAKKMEKISSDFLNDILDDITEESETESREKEPIKNAPDVLPQNKIEKGSLVRNILKSNLFDDQSEAQETVIAVGDSNDFNEQMDSQEIFKETALNSIATTSTEYRTMNDFLNTKIFDVDSEFYDRATYIKSLQAQLIESSQERVKLTQEIEVLKSKLAAEQFGKSLNSDRIESFSKRIDELKKNLNADNTQNLDSLWPKVESFIDSEINFLKKSHHEEIQKLNENISKERKDTEIEMNKLRQLLVSVKSDSSCVEELKRELEIKHANEMKELREYFEKRCIDMGKEYSEQVLSLNESINSRKIALSSHDLQDTDRDILTDDYAVSKNLTEI